MSNEISYQGKTYTLINDPTPTDRVFDGWWGHAKDGEEYVTEYSAAAEGEDGNEYVVRWQFYVIKGSEPADDEHEWERCYEVIPAY